MFSYNITIYKYQRKLVQIMKYLLILLIVLTGCSTSKTIHPVKTTSLKDDINESIINDFYDGDTTGVSSKIYLLK